MDETYVYLIAHQNAGTLAGPIKVGFSVSPGNRLRTLQTGNPSPLALVFSFLTPSAALAKMAEGVFHQVCVSDRISGEWFDTDPKSALATLTKVMAGCIINDVDDREHRLALLDWCGVPRAVDVFATLTDGVEA